MRPTRGRLRREVTLTRQALQGPADAGPFSLCGAAGWSRPLVGSGPILIRWHPSRVLNRQVIAAKAAPFLMIREGVFEPEAIERI
jgi:hypothetical protein